MSSQAADWSWSIADWVSSPVGYQGQLLNGFAVGGGDGGGGPVAFDDDLVDVGGVGGVHRLEAEVIQDAQVGAQQFAISVSWLLSSRAALSRLSSRSARSKWTVARRRTAAWPSAVAMKVLPVPTGPMIRTAPDWQAQGPSYVKKGSNFADTTDPAQTRRDSR
jgi:hypothetical protein